MTLKELKIEINKSLERVPETVLQDILDFLKQVENQPADKLSLAKDLKDILNEDKDLLQKLAQ